MLCTNCGKNPANAYKIRTAEGEKRLSLCSACYEKLYGGEGNDFFTSFLGSVEGRRKACPACGTTLDDYRHTGLLGCAHCYTAFRAELSPTIRFIQGRLEHAGKAPSAAAADIYDDVRRLVREQESLREQLKTAQRSGNYAEERAIRERLEALGRKINRGEPV